MSTEVRYTDPPQSRNEAILKATIEGTEYTDPPQSRIEDLLLDLKEVIEEGGGGGRAVGGGGVRPHGDVVASARRVCRADPAGWRHCAERGDL